MRFWSHFAIGTVLAACGQTPLAARVDAGSQTASPAAVSGAGGSAGAATAAGTGGEAGREVVAPAGRSATESGRSAPAKPTQTQIVVTNVGSAPIQLGSNCGGFPATHGGLWLELFDQSLPVTYDRYCKTSCENPSVAGCPALCFSTQTLVMPGENNEFIWDGIALDQSTNKGCYLETAPAPGTVLRAKACWNAPDGVRRPEYCREESFVYGRDLRVTLPARGPETAARSVTVKLRNRSQGPIEIVRERCGAQGWFELNMGKQYALQNFCPCSCTSRYERDLCPACGACAADVLATLDVGGSESTSWDGSFYYTYASGCSQRHLMPDDARVNVKVCYRKQAASDLTCTEAALELSHQSIIELETH